MSHQQQVKCNEGPDPGPVERRAAPRAPLPGVCVDHLARVDDGGADLTSNLLVPADVAEFGLESLFVSGPGAEALVVGGRYRVSVRFDGDVARVPCACVRHETTPRRGAVLQIAAGPQGAAGRALFALALKPSSVPPGSH